MSAGALLPTAAGADPISPPVCPVNGPQLCFTDSTATPPVTVPGAGDTAYVRFTATVQNLGGNTATHPAIDDLPPAAGMKVFSLSGTNPDGSAASCPDLAQATCYYENQPAGSKPATFEVVMSVDASTPVGSITNHIRSFVDEGTNDNPNGGKQDTTILDGKFSLVARDGSSVASLVPPGLQSKLLTTDKDGKAFAAATTAEQEVATTEIPLLSQPIFAGISRTSGDPCPGTCAMPDWMAVSVPDFANSSSKVLKTTLRVDSSLLLKSQSASTIVLYYQPVFPGPIQTLKVSRSCSGPGCFTATKEKDGDLTIVLSEGHNGRMRV